MHNDLTQHPNQYELFDHTMKEETGAIKTPVHRSTLHSQPTKPDEHNQTQHSRRSQHSRMVILEDRPDKKLLPKKFKQTSSLMEEKNSQAAKQKQQGRMSIYKGDEESLVCRRFPHLKECFCEASAQPASSLLWVKPCIAVGGMKEALETKALLADGVTHVLNVSSSEYFKRSQYFVYLNIDVYDNNDEDVKKNFRITNRFLSEALSKKGKVLVHDQGDLSRAATFILAFFINNFKVSLKQGLEQLRALLGKVDISTYFIKQLEQYDLEKLANSNLKTRLN